jgi:GNAT superfamily N-acetyltransferase
MMIPLRQRLYVKGLFHMMPFPAEPGLKIREARPADAAAIARVHVDAWHETYRGLVPDGLIDGMRYDEREAMWSEILSGRAGEQFVFVAELEGVCGFASGGPARSGRPHYSGELYAIYMLKKAQGRGAGRALFELIRARLASKDMKKFLVWVLERNPACGFYEAMGGVRIDSKDERYRGHMLREVAYGFGVGGNV